MVGATDDAESSTVRAPALAMSFTPLARVQYSQEHLSRAASSILRRTSQSSSSSRRKTGDTLSGDTSEGLLDSARDALATSALPPPTHFSWDPPDMWSRPYIGYMAHYVCIGMVNGILQNCLQPYCQYVAMGEPNQCSTLAAFVNLPWSYKLLYGLLSDTVPLFGQHRKPYIAIGWALTAAGALAGALLGELGITPPLELIAVLFLGITFAYLIADCAADAALVTFTTREPPSSRGSILATAYLVRFLSNVVASCVLAFLFNGPPTHGTFSFGLTTAQLLWIVCGSVGVLMGATLPMMVDHSGGGGELDTSSGESKGARALLRDFSRLMAQPAAWRLACAMTALTSLGLVNNNATNNANAEWFSMSPLQFGISAALNSVVLSVGMWAFKRWLLNVNWRITYAVGALGMQAFGLLYLLTIYYPYFRNGWWIVFTSQDQELAYALTFAIGVVIIPEITLPGYEGLTYGAITTFTNCAQNITSMINNLLLAVWPSNASRDDLKSDTPEVQRHMMYLTIATAAVALSSLAFLPLLPAQKDHIAQLRLRPAAPRAGNLMVAALALLMLFGTTFTILPVLPATSCLIIAGGNSWSLPCGANATAS